MVAEEHIVATVDFGARPESNPQLLPLKCTSPFHLTNATVSPSAYPMGDKVSDVHINIQVAGDAVKDVKKTTAARSCDPE